MTVKEIENYLSLKNTFLDSSVKDEIENLRLKAISKQNEDDANYFWCLKQIYNVQEYFLSAFHSLKNKKYINAWLSFDRADIELSFLERNFDIKKGNDIYHMMFIGQVSKEYQKLFPYRFFLSRECVIKEEKCSICGKAISFRNPCEHKIGKLYMGELCLREAVNIEFKGFALVADPFDKYAFIILDGVEYDYGMLERLMYEVKCPYQDFTVEVTKVKKQNYINTRENDVCPCGSGKKYKECHLNTKEELINHYIFQLK